MTPFGSLASSGAGTSVWPSNSCDSNRNDVLSHGFSRTGLRRLRGLSRSNEPAEAGLSKPHRWLYAAREPRPRKVGPAHSAHSAVCRLPAPLSEGGRGAENCALVQPHGASRQPAMGGLPRTRAAEAPPGKRSLRNAVRTPQPRLDCRERADRYLAVSDPRRRNSRPRS